VYPLRGLVQLGFISPAPLRPVPDGKPSDGAGEIKPYTFGMGGIARDK